DALFRVIRDLRAQGVAIVYISHRMSELVRIVSAASLSRDARARARERHRAAVPERAQTLLKRMPAKRVPERRRRF
ncbi:hypothetical protein ACWDR7_06245, partial [Microbacterium sp. NPDC003461]